MRYLLALVACLPTAAPALAQRAQARESGHSAAVASPGDKEPLAGVSGNPGFRHETVELREGGPPATVHFMYKPGVVDRHAAILMMGELSDVEVPEWSTNLLDEGFMLIAFRVAHPPDPDPKRRPQWLYFDQRFAHGYILDAKRMPTDAGRVIDHLITRGDVHPEKIGWFGASSTGIPGLAVATQEARLAAVLGFVTTGALRQWFETWHTNGLWKGDTKELWPETEELLRKHDPILHVSRMFPTAVLLVCGGDDKVVDPSTTRAFVDAARPYYKSDPSRLRLVTYESLGHNLPPNVVKMYAEHWFRLYLHPAKPLPKPAMASQTQPVPSEKASRPHPME